MPIAVVSMVGTPWDGDASPFQRARATRYESDDAVDVLTAGREIPSWADSFNHLIRPLQDRRRDRQAERLGGLEVDDELELGGLLDRKLGGLALLSILST
jgi:hypothetical protein